MKSLVSLAVLGAMSAVATAGDLVVFDNPNESYTVDRLSKYGATIKASDITITNTTYNGIDAYGVFDLNAANDISIQGATNGIFTPTDHENSSITIKTPKKLTITGPWAIHAEGKGTITIDAGDLVLRGSNGIAANSTGTISIDAQTVDIASTNKYGVSSANTGGVTIKAEKSICGAGSCAVAAVTAGTYEGQAMGKLSMVKAAVTLDAEGRLTDVKLDVSGETPALGGAAAEQMGPAFVRHQSTAVDGVSGATVSSEAIRKAVTAAIEKAGGDPKKYDVKVARKIGPSETMTADIVVVGAGASGTAAALAAAESGAKVIVLEKAPAVGGAGQIASGLFAVDSSLQKAKFKNNPELLKQLTADELYKQLMDYNHYLSNAKITRRVIDQSASTVDWLQGHGAKLELIRCCSGVSEVDL